MTACKVCGGVSANFCSADFNKTCEDRKSPPFAPSEQQISYQRCGDCGLIFTREFDRWSRDDFNREVYNDRYRLADPEYISVRPANHARLVRGEFGPHAATLSLLDYGAGNGSLIAHLAPAFRRVAGYDPMEAGFSSRPAGSFDLITCFETMEHTPSPRDTAADIASLLEPEGLILFSTMLQPPDIDQQRCAWWYLAPRNGHVTLYTAKALQRLWAQVGLSFVSFNGNYHAAFRRPPAFAANLLKKAGES